MAVTRITFVQEVDNQPNQLRDYGELSQGDTFENQHIYRLTNDDGSEQFLSVGIVHDSYGDSRGVGTIKLVAKRTKQVEVWE